MSLVGNFSESQKLQHNMDLSSVLEAIAIFYDDNFFDIKVKYPIQLYFIFIFCNSHNSQVAEPTAWWTR